MAWLLNQGDVLASVRVAGGIGDHVRLPGLLRRSPVVILHGGTSLLTTGVSSELLIVLCDETMTIQMLKSMKPWRLTLYRPKYRWVVVAPMEIGRRWSVSVGDQLELRLTEESP